MTKTQQKFARQATTFLNCGGKALTALLRMLLLLVAVVFEGISKIFLILETSTEDTQENERARRGSEVHAIEFTPLPDGQRLDRAFARDSSRTLAATAGGRGHTGK
jgi:hypothetical protein